MQFYHSVNVINYGLAQQDNIKKRPLYKKVKEHKKFMTNQQNTK